MNLIKSILLGLAITAATGAFAEPVFTKGVVKKVAPDAGKVTIIHEELVNLDMPAMTMVFRVADEAMFEQLEPGDDIEFVADRVNGKLTVTDLK
ncbi:periplasmic copper-binding protein [Roseovarius gaetbuli]|uniref:Periplasmic copper-binding protein n=1 Tax=Roseovarius gaetbuli TaxID=1356575 RepID=A0A1X7ACJ4_9RHOB|nr:copper-binding protein [Roseovarius gaetbuli]SLN76393.1 periplasmic copper-binding protein [Roseovarius gaetbuli]